VGRARLCARILFMTITKHHCAHRNISTYSASRTRGTLATALTKPHTPRTHERIVSSPNLVRNTAMNGFGGGVLRTGQGCHHTHLVCFLAAPAAPLPLTTLQIKRAATTNEQHMQRLWAPHVCNMQRRQSRAETVKGTHVRIENRVCAGWGDEVVTSVPHRTHTLSPDGHTRCRGDPTR
jgi:hypothetical protein